MIALLLVACVGEGKDVAVADTAEAVECTSWSEGGCLVDLCCLGGDEPACWYTDGQERWDCEGDDCTEAGAMALEGSCSW